MSILHCTIATVGQRHNQMVLMNIQSNGNKQITCRMNAPNHTISLLEQELNRITTPTTRRVNAKALCDVLEQGRNALVNANNNSQGSDYLAILYTDGSLSFDCGPLIAAAEFEQRDITLFIVAHRTPPYQIWDDLHTLAEATGGAYAYEANASDLFRSVIFFFSKKNIQFVKLFCVLNQIQFDKILSLIRIEMN